LPKKPLPKARASHVTRPKGQHDAPPERRAQKLKIDGRTQQRIVAHTCNGHPLSILSRAKQRVNRRVIARAVAATAGHRLERRCSSFGIARALHRVGVLGRIGAGWSQPIPGRPHVFHRVPPPARRGERPLAPCRPQRPAAGPRTRLPSVRTPIPPRYPDGQRLWNGSQGLFGAKAAHRQPIPSPPPRPVNRAGRRGGGLSRGSLPSDYHGPSPAAPVPRTAGPGA